MERTRNGPSALQTASLTIKVKKSKWAVSEMIFHGHVISEKGIKTDPEKVQDIKIMSRQKTSQESEVSSV